jgi:S1-C subfamily serine protease
MSHYRFASDRPDDFSFGRIFFCLLLGWGLFPLSGYGSDPMNSTLFLCVERRDGREVGSAVLVDLDEHWALTTFHLVQGSVNPIVLPPIRNDRGEVIQQPQANWDRINQKKAIDTKAIWHQKSADLSLIRLENLPPTARSVSLRSNSLLRDDSCEILGNPIGENRFFHHTEGILRSSQRMSWEWPNRQFICTQIQFIEGKAPLTQGFSGGPVLDSEGKLAGIVLASPDLSQNRFYAIDVRTIREFLSRCYVLESARAFFHGNGPLAKQRIDKALRLTPKSGSAKFMRYLLSIVK